MTSTGKVSKLEKFSRTLSTSKKNVCWTCIFRFVIKNDYHTISPSDLSKSEPVVSFLTAILIKYDCSEKDLLLKFLLFCIQWYFKSCTCQDKPPENEFLGSITKSLAYMKSLSALPVCIVSAPVLSALSKYGFDIEQSVFHHMNSRKVFTDFMVYVQEKSVAMHSVSELDYLTTRIMTDYMNNEDRETVCCLRGRGKNYIFLIIKNLQAINLSFVARHAMSNYLKYLNMFYRTIPDPIVSHQDMKEFLRIVWTTSNFQPDYQPVMFGIYKSIFGNKIPERYSPRPLKHLCRIFLRNILKRNYKLLPKPVKTLKIPRELHDYLLCQRP